MSDQREKKKHWSNPIELLVLLGVCVILINSIYSFFHSESLLPIPNPSEYAKVNSKKRSPASITEISVKCDSKDITSRTSSFALILESCTPKSLFIPTLTMGNANFSLKPLDEKSLRSEILQMNGPLQTIKIQWSDNLVQELTWRASP